MRISNKYVLFWDSITKMIQNDYTEEISEDYNYDFSSVVNLYASDSIEEIENKISELSLIPFDEASVDTYNKRLGDFVSDKMSVWEYPEYNVRVGLHNSDQLSELCRRCPQILVGVKDNSLPFIVRDGISVIYLPEINDECRGNFESVGAKIELK